MQPQLKRLDGDCSLGKPQTPICRQGKQHVTHLLYGNSHTACLHHRL